MDWKSKALIYDFTTAADATKCLSETFLFEHLNNFSVNHMQGEITDY